MTKRWRKQKSEQQSKKRRRSMRGTGDASSAGGALGGMRKFTRGLFGGNAQPRAPKTAVNRAVDIVLWVAVAVAGYFFVARQCMR